MDIADYSHWGADMDYIGLSHEHLFGFLAYFSQQRFVQQLFTK
jgi:hypothetical protein